MDLEAEWERFLSSLPWRAHMAWDKTTKEGSPASLIAEKADRQGAALIVRGSRGCIEIPHRLLGSVAEGVARFMLALVQSDSLLQRSFVYAGVR